MGCDIHIRGEVRTDGKWAAVGEVFESHSGATDYKPATRANLEALSDGELMDAVGLKIGHYDELRARLSTDAEAACAAWRLAHDADVKAAKGAVEDWRNSLTSWERDNPDEAPEYDGYVPDDHPLAYSKVVEPTQRRQTRLRREGVELTSGARESIVAAVDGFRPYGDDEERCDFQLEPTDTKAFCTVEPWDGRNYNLFAMLADVRNGRGFAGVATGEGFVPIAPVRGVPEDASDEYRALVNGWGGDGHSHSWHDVATLRAYDWDGQSTIQFGAVAADVYEQCREAGTTPQSWTGGTSGAGIGVLERPVHPADEIKPYVRMEWRTTYREAAGTAWFRTLDQLEALIPDGGDATDVRLVFFFDN